MGIFNSYDENTGVEKNQPRKKGLSRFFEIIARDFWDLVKLNFVFALICLPSAVLFFAAVFSGLNGPLIMVLSLICALPIGGGLSGLFFCISKMLRDDPGFALHDFKRKFKENFKNTAITGVFFTGIVYSQIFMVIILAGYIEAGIFPAWIAAYLAVSILFYMIAPYYFLQADYLELKSLPLLKNSVLLSLSNGVRSFAGALCGLFPWALTVLFAPLFYGILPIFILIMFSLSCLMTLMWIWPGVNERFNIEQILNERKQRELDGTLD